MSSIEEEKRYQPTSKFKIVRENDGFAVSNAEEYPGGKFLVRGDITVLEHILDHAIIPLVSTNPTTTLPELIKQIEGSSQLKENFKLRHIPWTGLHLLAQWKLDQVQQEKEPQRDPVLNNAARLLEEWYRPLRAAHYILNSTSFENSRPES